MHMRSEMAPLCGRDHLAFRSYYFPVRNVIDGDLCEMYNSLETSKQRSIAEELDRTPSEVTSHALLCVYLSRLYSLSLDFIHLCLRICGSLFSGIQET